MQDIEKTIVRILQSDLSNKKLSELSGVDYATISRLRSGKKSIEGLQVATVKKLFNILPLIR